MKTDRELLELAAKALGATPAHTCLSGGEKIPFSVPVIFVIHGEEWNPLTDDGDAMRLAALKEMCIDFMNQRVIAGDNFPEVIVDFSDGDYKRAIVCAAAAIGEAM